jgi:methionyl-tRNA formyltransferase
MRIVFMGTPAFAVPALHALSAAGHDIVAAYTQPPRPAMRGKQPQRSAVHLAAEALGIAVMTPRDFRSDTDRQAFAAHAADVAVVAAYGLILPAAVLAMPRHGCLNIHASLLPRWRGAAPIQRAILAGDEQTGITIMQMEKGLDTGPMLLSEATSIGRKTAGELTDELAGMGARLIVKVLADLPDWPAQPQPETGISYASKIEKAEAAIDWTRPAADIERAVRAFNPVPGAYLTLAGERIRVLAADVIAASGPAGATIDDAFAIACGAGALRPTLVQRAGKRAMGVDDMLRGRPVPAGTMLD